MNVLPINEQVAVRSMMLLSILTTTPEDLRLCLILLVSLVFMTILLNIFFLCSNHLSLSITCSLHCSFSLGKDADEMFEDIGHSSEARTKLKEYLIGTLKVCTETSDSDT